MNNSINEKNDYLKYLKYKKKYMNLCMNKMNGGNDKNDKNDKNHKYGTDIKLFMDNQSSSDDNKKVLDSLGEMQVPKDKYWGGVTARYLKYFPNNFTPVPFDLISNYAILKKCAAIVNQKNNLIDEDRSKIIQLVCDEIIDGKLNDNFPITIWQTGSGTTTNMNINEVIANIANKIIYTQSNTLNDNNYIHQNDHVNKSQSSNDSFITNLHICFVHKIITKLQPVLQNLILTLDNKSKEFSKIYKIGRTHLQDAVPLTFGQEFSGYKILIENNYNSIMYSLNALYEISLGGTAVGTGINTTENFGNDFSDELNKYFANINDEYNNFVNTKIKSKNNDVFKNTAVVKFVSAPNKFAGISTNNSLVMLSSALKELAVNLIKIANDLRWMVSGPTAGLEEIIIQQNEPGSSIMPGKVNPTQAEVIVMVAIEIMANDVAVTLCGSQGNFELNVCRPLTYYKINESIDLLIDHLQNFNENMLLTIKINKKKVKEYLHNNVIIATLMNNEIGYENVSKIVHYSLDNNISLEETCKKLGYTEQYNKIIKPIIN
jgi:fumarate hydratase class II